LFATCIEHGRLDAEESNFGCNSQIIWVHD
jgi:hypothetical protein